MTTPKIYHNTSDVCSPITKGTKGYALILYNFIYTEFTFFLHFSCGAEILLPA